MLETVCTSHLDLCQNDIQNNKHAGAILYILDQASLYSFLNRASVRPDPMLAVTKESVFPTTKIKASHATATMAMPENLAVRNYDNY